MKRVLHIIGGMNRAGAETMIMNIYRTIDRSKIQFDFLVYKNERQDYEDEIESLGGRVIHLSVKPGILGLLKTVPEIRKIIKTNGPYCAIHTATLHNSAFPLISSIGIKGLNRISHSHSTANGVNDSLSTKIYNFLTKVIIRHISHYYLACGHEAGEYLFGKKKFQKSGIILNNCINLDTFYDVKQTDVCNFRRSLGVKDEILIGSVARLNAVKNHSKMIKIAKCLDVAKIPFKMIFVGTGDLEGELNENIKYLELTDKVLLLGTRSDINVIMKALDVFLMPSIFEGNPVTLIEAQASGLPAVISDTITDKIDLGLNLINRVPLEADEQVWMEKVLSTKRDSISKSKIAKQLEAKGYSLEENTKLLYNIYIS